MNSFSNTPERVWPLYVSMVTQDDSGKAIEVEGLTSRLYGVAAESPQLGDTVNLVVNGDHQEWVVADRSWVYVFPVEGQATPCSVLDIGLRKLSSTKDSRSTQDYYDQGYAQGWADYHTETGL